MDVAGQVARQYADRLRQQSRAAQQPASPETPVPAAAAASLGGVGGLATNADIRRSPQAIHADILAAVDEIEKIIPQLTGPGHNIGTLPLTAEQIAQVKIDINVAVRVEPTATEVPTALGRVGERLKQFGQIISAAGTIDRLWERFGEHLTALGSLIWEYIKALMHLF